MREFLQEMHFIVLGKENQREFQVSPFLAGLKRSSVCSAVKLIILLEQFIEFGIPLKVDKSICE